MTEEVTTEVAATEQQTATETEQVTTQTEATATATEATETQATETERQAWADDWRDRMARGDEKRLSVLKRYASPETLADALFSLRQKVSSGELKEPFPADGKPEDQAKWRETNGIPDAPEKYELSLPDGLTVGEDDKAIVAAVQKAAHEANLPVEAFNGVAAAYFKAIDDFTAQQADQDAAWKEETEENLRAEFGADYKRNLAAVENFLGTLPDGLGARLAHARLSDGRPLGADPVAVRWLIQTAQELNPLATLVPGGAGDIKGIETEIAELKKVMRDDPKTWYNSPDKQKRYQELLAAQEKLGTKAA